MLQAPRDLTGDNLLEAKDPPEQKSQDGKTLQKQKVLQTKRPCIP
jgi:hypothetical protein